MARKPSAVVNYKLRIRETLRRQIEKAAKANGVSANAEMVRRLETSFTHEATRTIDDTAADISGSWARFGQAFHELNKQGDLLRATEALVAQIEQLPAEARQGAAIKTAVAQVRQVTDAIDTEARLLTRLAHTGGAQ